MKAHRAYRRPVGRALHALPSDGGDHRATSACECGPTASHRDAATGGVVWIHWPLVAEHELASGSEVAGRRDRASDDARERATQRV